MVTRYCAYALHIAAAAVFVSALSFLFIVIVFGPHPGTTLYGEALEERVVMWLVGLPGLIGLGALTVIPYRRLYSSSSQVRRVLLLLAEGGVAVGLAVLALWSWSKIVSM